MYDTFSLSDEETLYRPSYTPVHPQWKMGVRLDSGPNNVRTVEGGQHFIPQGNMFSTSDRDPDGGARSDSRRVSQFENARNAMAAVVLSAHGRARRVESYSWKLSQR